MIAEAQVIAANLARLEERMVARLDFIRMQRQLQLPQLRARAVRHAKKGARI